jgi:hypothetical protein
VAVCNVPLFSSRGRKNESPLRVENRAGFYVFEIKSGGVLLSHAASRAVPSALRGLTSVFGMGTGVTLSTKPPENLKEQKLKGFENRIVKLKAEPCKHLLLVSKFYGQAEGLISTGQLNVLLRFHTQPINVVVYHESHWQVSSWVWLHA